MLTSIQTIVMTLYRPRKLSILILVAALSLRAAGHSSATPESVRVELARARQLPTTISAKLDPVIEAIWQSFDRQSAGGQVEFMSRYWRLAGNEGYDRSLDRIQARLAESGLKAMWVEQTRGQGHGWDHSAGTLAIVRDGQADQVLLSREKERLALCINSFSTAAGGVVAPLVDVGRGRPEDYRDRNVKGAVVLGDADAGQLWREATSRGAIGIVSTSLAAYVNPSPPGSAAPARDEWDILQWSSIPYDDARKGFGFKATPRAAATLRKALAAGPVRVRAEIQSSFTDAPERTLVAEIPGRSRPAERVVLAAHLQEPGASDNASGSATLMEMARALARGIAAGTIPPPERTITMLWLNEISGSRQWLQTHADQKPGIRYMFSMDMTGEDIAKTGGSFLVERWPDPGAVWERPWDPHSEWGRGNVKAESLKGDLINDVHLAVCERVAAKSAWIVRTNPYEGGSDHTVFGSAGVPSLLNWHFTDRYYHTNMDTADKTSADEMRNAGTAMASSAWLLASSDERMSAAAAELVAKAGEARVAVEQREDPNPAIVTAWKKWYAEAVLSAARLATVPVSSAFREQLSSLARRFSAAQ